MQKSYYVVDHNTIIKLIFSVRGRHKLSFAVLALSGADLQGHKKGVDSIIHDLSGLLLEIS